MADDLVHIRRQIQDDEIKAQAARQQADRNRNMAQQQSSAGNSGRADLYNQEAQRYEQEETQRRDEAADLQNKQQDLQQKETELIQKREQLVNDHNAQLRQVDDELARVRGAGF